MNTFVRLHSLSILFGYSWTRIIRKIDINSPNLHNFLSYGIQPSCTGFTLPFIFLRILNMDATEDKVDEMKSLVKSDFNCKKIPEICFVSSVCGVIFSCFCVPIIIYVTSSDVKELGIDQLNIDNCSQQVSRE